MEHVGRSTLSQYTITAVASIPFDSNTTNNVKEGMIRIKVRIMGDINGDGKVDMRDIALAASAFGSERVIQDGTLMLTLMKTAK